MNKLLFYNEKEMYLPCREWHFFSSILITCNWIYLICQWNRRSVKHLFEYSWILIYHIQLNYSVTTVYRFLTVECKLSWTATGPRSGLGGWWEILITIPYPSYLLVDPLTAGFQLIINGQDWYKRSSRALLCFFVQSIVFNEYATIYICFCLCVNIRWQTLRTPGFFHSVIMMGWLYIVIQYVVPFTFVMFVE